MPFAVNVKLHRDVVPANYYAFVKVVLSIEVDWERPKDRTEQRWLDTMNGDLGTYLLPN